MGSYIFTKKEFTYLAFNVFATDFDEPPNWQAYDFDEKFLFLFQEVRDKYLTRESDLEMYKNERNAVDFWHFFDAGYILDFTEEEVDMICAEVKVALRESVADPKFEEYLELGNNILENFSNSPLRF